MKSSGTPKDGDFASYLEAKSTQAGASEALPSVDNRGSAPETKTRQTIQQVLGDGEQPTEAFLEEWNALESAPQLSDEELARQALEAPGDDGDPTTPE